MKEFRSLEKQVRNGKIVRMVVTRNEKGQFVDTVSLTALTGRKAPGGWEVSYQSSGKEIPKRS